MMPDDGARLRALIDDWRDNSTMARANADNRHIATLDRRQCEGVSQAYEQCANELEEIALLLVSESHQQEEIDSLRAEKHGAYHERNQLVATLSKLWPSHWCNHPEDDASWDDEWRTIICIHSPVGQLTWHIKISEQQLFNHLPKGPSHWDGHTTDEKYARLATLVSESHQQEHHENRSPDGDGRSIAKGLGDERALPIARGDDIATVITPPQARVHAREGTERNDVALLKPAAGSEPADSHQFVTESHPSDRLREAIEQLPRYQLHVSLERMEPFVRPFDSDPNDTGAFVRLEELEAALRAALSVEAPAETKEQP